METKITPQILIISGACCSPNLAKLDQALEQEVTQVLKDINSTIEVRKVSLGGILNNGEKLTPKQYDQIMALFHKYGTKFTPALMVNDNVCHAGQPPSIEQLKDILQKVI